MTTIQQTVRAGSSEPARERVDATAAGDDGGRREALGAEPCHRPQ
jgi:hypothetical protein